MELVKIGQITAPHGISGEVRVYPLTDFPERFRGLTQVLLGPAAVPTSVRVTGTVKELVILQIEGVTDRTQAEKLRGQYLQVTRAEAHPLPEGSHYIFDLIGLAVVDPEGRLLGKLVDVDHSSPAHDLYVVETEPGQRYFVPAVREFVREVDPQKGHVVVAPIPGLLSD